MQIAHNCKTESNWQQHLHIHIAAWHVWFTGHLAILCLDMRQELSSGHARTHTHTGESKGCYHKNKRKRKAGASVMFLQHKAAFILLFIPVFNSLKVIEVKSYSTKMTIERGWHKYKVNISITKAGAYEVLKPYYIIQWKEKCPTSAAGVFSGTESLRNVLRCWQCSLTQGQC